MDGSNVEVALKQSACLACPPDMCCAKGSAEPQDCVSATMHEVIGALGVTLVAALVGAVLRLRQSGYPRYAPGGAVGTGVLVTVVAAGVDFCFDIWALGELRGSLATAGHAAIALSMTVNAVAIVVVLRRAVRDETLDLEACHDLSSVVTMALLLAVTNLDSLVLLPWVLPTRAGGGSPARRRQGEAYAPQHEDGQTTHSFLGFPTRDLVLLTMVGIVFENLPQLVITYHNADQRFLSQGRSVPLVMMLSMASSASMVVFSIVRKLLSNVVGGALLGKHEQRKAKVAIDDDDASDGRADGVHTDAKIVTSDADKELDNNGKGEKSEVPSEHIAAAEVHQQLAALEQELAMERARGAQLLAERTAATAAAAEDEEAPPAAETADRAAEQREEAPIEACAEAVGASAEPDATSTEEASELN